MKKVVVVQRVVPHYRVKFFELLHEKLLEHNVQLSLVYGQEDEGSVPKTVHINEPWAKYIPNKYIKVFGKELVLQTKIDTSEASLVVVEQANRLLCNYILFVKKFISKYKFAFWGHGKNFQSNQGMISLLKEKFKSVYTQYVDGFFAYTEGGRKLIEASVVELPVYVLNNSIDTTGLKHAYDSLRREEVEDLKTQLGIRSENVAIYCGGMYKEKCIDFLIDSILKVKEKVHDFEVVLIGNGPDSYKVKEFSAKHPWCHYVGYVSGFDRVKYFSLAKVLLMPGLVGLAVLDSFALETPMLTTNVDFHSPEIEYLKNNVNGTVTEHNIDDYSKEICKILKDKSYFDSLVDGCKHSYHSYSLENMVANYADGVLELLGMRKV